MIVGAGAGLTVSAGFQYKGKRFWKYFRDFAEKYHFRDMYAGSFFHFPAVEEYWAYWSRYAYISRYMDAQRPVYRELLELVHDKDYLVITTNVNHAFQKAGWDSERLLCLNGDFGLFQCSRPCSQDTYENEEIIRRMVVSQGYEIDGEVTTEFPTTAKLEKAKPVLKTLPGWKCDIRGIKNYEDLPENCRKYVEFIEEQIGFPITMVSNGPGRDDIIYR